LGWQRGKRGMGVRCYQDDRDWSDRFTPAIKRIICPYLLEEAAPEADAKEATDLVGKHLRIACRVRHVDYWKRYPDQFTIRSRRDSGAKTELAKILDGHGDWMFYGFHDEGDTIRQWYLIDLHAFRWHWVMFRDCVNSQEIPNGDGTYFRAFWIRSFPEFPPLLISEGF
jgi:hypothetical protein